MHFCAFIVIDMCYGIVTCGVLFLTKYLLQARNSVMCSMFIGFSFLSTVQE